MKGFPLRGHQTALGHLAGRRSDGAAATRHFGKQPTLGGDWPVGVI